MGLANKLAAAGQTTAAASAPPMPAGGAAPPPGAGYPPQPQGYGAPPQQGYPPQQQGYPGGPPPQQGYPPQQQGYPGGPPPQQGYPGGPPLQQGYPGGPPPQQGYPPQQQGYPGGPPPQQGYGAPPPQQGYPPQGYGAPPQQQGYPGAPPPQPGQPGGPPQGGAPPAAAHGAPPVAGRLPPGTLLPKLQSVVQANSLHAFYPPPVLAALAQRIEQTVDFHALAAKWAMPMELALDFVGLALYDIIIYADDSGSMAFEEGGERIEDLKLILGRVAEVATLFDQDGITICFMNSDAKGNNVKSAAEAAALVSSLRFAGTTPLAASMERKVLGGCVFTGAPLSKPYLIVTITDGEPTDTPKNAILRVIRDALARLATHYGPKPLAFQFAQVGKDARAQAFLATLDKDPAVGRNIDCTSYYELEAAEYAAKGVVLSVEAWMLKLMVGAIDPSYDAEDE